MRGDLAQLTALIEEEARKKAVGTYVVAIDGRSAAGKSTLAAALGDMLELDPVHMDDFFLPGELRTEERLCAPGGNVHYERFAAEVLAKLSAQASFSYTRFDCKIMDYGPAIHVRAGKIRLVEGAYSFHPYYGDYADLKIFYNIAPRLQLQRIERRNGPEGLRNFQSRWIPMEENYHVNCHTQEQADIVIRAGDFTL